MIIGREYEMQIFNDLYNSGKAELVCVYGRRRVGKTFLVNEYFRGKFAFKYTAVSSNGVDKKNVNRLQLERFGMMVDETAPTPPADWFEAFDRLKTRLKKERGRKVVFIDELPWMDTPRSFFLSAFENFWNGWACTQPDLLLIVCGSATSWIINKLLKNKGGLHNRITRRIHLQPFDLGECEAYFRSTGIKMSRHDMLVCYMIMGGIPYYLSQLDKRLSLAQNIDALFFHSDGLLRNEYPFLFASLFKRPEPYMKIVDALCRKPQRGLSIQEIEKIVGKTSGGSTNRCLSELENCGFIQSYLSYGNIERGKYYKVVDFYTLFYHKFIKDQKGTDEHYWTTNLNTPKLNAWAGEAFERVCLAHVPQIKRKIGIGGISTSASSLVCRMDGGKAAAQIDLLLVRADRVVDVCEIKFSNTPYTITKKYDRVLRDKLAAVATRFPARFAVHLIMITSNGLVRNAYSGIAQNEVVADDLF